MVLYSSREKDGRGHESMCGEVDARKLFSRPDRNLAVLNIIEPADAVSKRGLERERGLKNRRMVSRQGVISGCSQTLGS